MIDALFKRRISREFLKGYSEELYRDVIPDVFEIGVLSLKNSFNKMQFTKGELNEILEDLRNGEYNPDKDAKAMKKLNVGQSADASGNPEVQYRTKKVKENVYPSWWNHDEDNEINEEIQRELRRQERKKKKKHHNHENNKKYDYYKETTTSFSEESYKERKPMTMKKLTKGECRPATAYPIKNRINYKISYDKKLRPQSIEKKSKEPQNTYVTDEKGLKRTPSVKRMQPLQMSNNYSNSNQGSLNNTNSILHSTSREQREYNYAPVSNQYPGDNSQSASQLMKSSENINRYNVDFHDNYNQGQYDNYDPYQNGYNPYQAQMPPNEMFHGHQQDHLSMMELSDNTKGKFYFIKKKIDLFKNHVPYNNPNQGYENYH